MVVVAPVILVHGEVPLALTCHCVAGVGLPEAIAAKLAIPPLKRLVLLGWPVIVGATFSVSRAAVEVAEPTEFVNTARNSMP